MPQLLVIQSDRWEICTFFQLERNRQDGNNCSVGGRAQNINNFMKSPEAGVNLSTSIAPNWILLSGGSSRWQLFFSPRRPPERLARRCAAVRLAVPRPEKWKILLLLPWDRGRVFIFRSLLWFIWWMGDSWQEAIWCVKVGDTGWKNIDLLLSCDYQKESNSAPFSDEARWWKSFVSTQKPPLAILKSN